MAESIAAWLFLLALLATLAAADKLTATEWWARRVDRGRATEREIAEFDRFMVALRDGRPVS